MVDPVLEGAKFLDELSKLIRTTDLRILKQAKKNVWTRLENAVKHNEATIHWLYLWQMVTAAVDIKEDV
jgi:hypothetical protein